MNPKALVHWLLSYENPVQQFGFFPVFIWYSSLLIVGLCFFYLEGCGLARIHGMVPLTWVWRCLPRIIWFAIAAVGIWHFAVVQTKVK